MILVHITGLGWFNLSSCKLPLHEIDWVVLLKALISC